MSGDSKPPGELPGRIGTPVPWDPPRPFAQAIVVVVAFAICWVFSGTIGVAVAESLTPSLWMPRLAPLVVAVAGVLSYVVAVRWLECRWPLELRIRRIPELVSGLVLGTLLCLGLVAVLLGGGWLTFEGQRSTHDLAAAILVAGVVTGVAEELVFRGLLFRHIEHVGGTWVALGVTTVVFALIHAANPHASVWTTLCVAIEGGLFIGVVFALTRSLWLVIGLHAAWNTVQGPLLGSPVSGQQADGWLRSSAHGSPLWSGGAFGLEGSAFTLLVFALIAGVCLALLLATPRFGPRWKPFPAHVIRRPALAPGKASSR